MNVLKKFGVVMSVLVLMAAVSLGTLYLAKGRGPDNRQNLEGMPARRAPFTKDGAAVASTGWIEPEQGVLRVAAPIASGRSPIVSKLFVNEGDVVETGQLLAELQGLTDLRAALQQAQSHLSWAQRRLAQVKAAPRSGDVEAARTQLDRLSSERKAVQNVLERQEGLLAKDYIARVQVDATRLRIEQLDFTINEARERLNSLSEIRPADVDVAEADAHSGEADVARARADLSFGTVLSPHRGRVVRVLAHAGEAVGPAGLLELAPAGRMTVVAEIYETDASRVHVGQRATVSSEVLPRSMSGTVIWVSPQIEKRESPSLDPSAFSEARVFNTRILLDGDKVLEDRIHAKVNVLIQP